MATTRPENRLRKKKKPPKRFRLSYSLLLLFAMIVVGSVSGLVAYKFGKQALEGVNPSPTGIKLPKISPVPKPKESPKSSSQSQDDKVSFLLDEAEVIAEMKAQAQQELGGLRRPNPVAKTNTSDRRSIYARVDRAYNSMRDPLAISATADERIAERIAELRRKVYTSSRSYNSSFDRPIANNASASLPSLSTPVELTSIRSSWEDRDAALLNLPKAPLYTQEGSAQPSRSFFILDRQMPSTGNGDRR